jgi:hypothetical protein
VGGVRVGSAIVSVGVALLLAGCGGGDEPGTADVPPPPIARLLSPDYRAQEVLKANLTDGPVPETVVTSVGPPTGQLGFHPATIQVISWDALAKRWTVIFDAQKVIAPDAHGPRTSNGGPGVYPGSGDPRPVLDPEADVTLELVDFAPLLKGDRDQLVFSATLSYGGSGLPQTLVVADFKDAKARVLYDWSGEHLDVELKGDRIHARSSYWTRADSHCCPSRDYRFQVGASGDSVTVLEDERPYLGVLVRERGKYFGEGPLEILEVTEGSPAAGKLRPGDVLLDVENAPPPERTFSDPEGEPLYNKLSAFDAGETARLVVSRDGGPKMGVPVKLGSLKDAQTMPIPEDDDRVDAI